MRCPTCGAERQICRSCGRLAGLGVDECEAPIDYDTSRAEVACMEARLRTAIANLASREADVKVLKAEVHALRQAACDAIKVDIMGEV